MSNNAIRTREPHAQNLTIAEMSHLYNVSLRTLRFYEERGLLTPTRAGISRLYSPRDQIRLQVILTGRKLGFSLREIDLMLWSHVSNNHAEPKQMFELLDLITIEAQIKLLCDKKADVEASINELKAALS